MLTSIRPGSSSQIPTAFLSADAHWSDVGSLGVSSSLPASPYCPPGRVADGKKCEKFRKLWLGVSSAATVELIDGFGSDFKVADIPWLRMNVDVILYQSIALEQLYIFSFESETTGPGVWPLIGRILDLSRRHSLLTPRPFSLLCDRTLPLIESQSKDIW